MECLHYQEEDAIHITVRQGVSARTKQLDDNRYVGIDEDDALMWVSIINVSEGVDLEDIFDSEEDYAVASRFLDDRNIRLFA